MLSVSSRGSTSPKPIAKIDRNGEVAEIYPSLEAAARANYMSHPSVYARCTGKIKKPFEPTGYTFRYASEDET